ncbi:Mdm33 family-domain-containing protein [Plectosphaerella plurivora]|uniref:Sensitive to high expression protein 9, mitochondrial n=1 Tax=Plectosphaerella plurivora TaxID=936078 RepID=A0A9P9A560_9PEZI|nr:Mdm33 family-domain-containing protein [Plectosphaerella plurivora]
MQPLARAAAWPALSRGLVSRLSSTGFAAVPTLPRRSPSPRTLVGRQFSTSPLLKLQPPKSHETKPETDQGAATPLESHLPSETSTSPSSSTSSPAETTDSESTPKDSSTTTTPLDDAQSPSPSSQQPSSPASPLAISIPRLIDTLQARLLTASQTLNDITGYTDIERIKVQNATLETRLQTAHDELRQARTAYKSSTALRASTQREVTTLLARKETWSPLDVERFTELYRRDHTLEQEVAAAAERLNEAESDQQRLSQDLMAGMLRRYHEEQIWSDRIRRASTWGTWGLMGVNVLLFIVLQFFAEPWRRRRLVRAVVEEEKDVLHSVREELAAVRGALTAAATVAAAPAEPVLVEGVEVIADTEALPILGEDTRETVVAAEVPLVEEHPAPAPVSWMEFLSDPQLVQAWASDLYSERRIDFRMKDASILALQAGTAGAAVAASIAVLLLKRA